MRRRGALCSLLALTGRLLRRRGGRLLCAALLLVLICWAMGIPAIRLTYAGAVYPLRSLQYYFSPVREDALRLAHLSGLTPGHGTPDEHLDNLGLWAILRELRRHGIPRHHQAVALAIVQQESAFRFYSMNPRSSACGLYQLISATGRSQQLSWWQCMDPVANARAGSAFFRQIIAKSPESFEGTVRCAYLKHYYGPANGCAGDRNGIWPKVGRRMAGRAALYLKALQQLDAEQARRGFIEKAFRAARPYFPVVLAVLCLTALSRIGRRPGAWLFRSRRVNP